MREYLVTLRCGKKYTVKADRVRSQADYLALVVTPQQGIGDLDPFDGVVALFEQKQVAVVVVRDHLIAEEKGDPIDPHYVASDPDSDIPF